MPAVSIRGQALVWPRWVPLVLLVAALGAALPRFAAATEVTVRAHTAVSLDARASGREVHVSGTLRDNLNQGLAERELDLRLEPIAGRGRRGPALEYRLTTDQNGHFDWADRLQEGRWEARLTFPGDALLAAAETQTVLVVERERARLELRAPAAVPAAGLLPVGITLLGPTEAVAGQPLELRLAGRPVATGLITDAVGEAQAPLGDLPGSGRHRLVARFAGDDVLAPASAERWVIAYLQASLQLEALVDEQRAGRRLLVSGRLDSDVGPIAGAWILLEVPGLSDPLRTRTDEDGAFARNEAIDWLQPASRHAVRAHFDPLGEPDPALRVSAEAPFAVPPSPLASASKLAGVAALLLLGGVLAVLVATRVASRLRRARDDAAAPTPPGHRAPEGLVELAPPPPGRKPLVRRVSGTVCDGDTGRTVDSGTVEVTVGADLQQYPIATDGSFSTAELPDGTADVVVRVSGYVATRFQLAIPHHGRHSGVRVHVVSVRSWVRYLYQRLTLELDLEGGEARWGRATPRQIERLLMTAVSALRTDLDEGGAEAFRAELREALADPARVPADRVLRALTLLVEEVYYSGRLYEETLLGLCRSLVAGVREAARGAEAVGEAAMGGSRGGA